MFLSIAVLDYTTTGLHKLLSHNSSSIVMDLDGLLISRHKAEALMTRTDSLVKFPVHLDASTEVDKSEESTTDFAPVWAEYNKMWDHLLYKQMHRSFFSTNVSSYY